MCISLTYNRVFVRIICTLLLLSSCYRGSIYVQQQPVNKSYLASSHIGTPDHRQKHPDIGQNIVVSWHFPLNVYRKDFILYLTVRFWDHTEEVLSYKLERKSGNYVFFFSKERKILTYLVEVKNKDNEIVSSWQHQFWTKLISDLEE